jgi:putative endonuclease
MDDQFIVYVLKSSKDRKRYTGMTTNMVRRLQEHNEGKVRSTKARIPFVVIYQEQFNTRLEARSREKYFKTAAGRRFLSKVIDQV